MAATIRRPPVRFGAFEADLAAGELRKHGRRLKVPYQAFRVLEQLIEHPMQVVTRDELRQSLWPADTHVEFDHGLNNAVNRLREALGDDAQKPRFIETLPRRGYRFVAPLIEPAAPFPADDPTTVPPAAPIATLEPRLAVGASSTRLTILAGGLAVVIVALVVSVSGRWRSTDADSSGQVESVAVLPFRNLSGDAGQDFFADGLTESLIVELSRIGGFRVISPTSVMQYKDSRKRAAAIAGELGVDALIEGSVVREGRRVRVSAQLVRGDTETPLWARSFDREIETILSLQREVARAIAGEIRMTVAGAEPAPVERRIDPDVYELYLRGRHFLHRRTEVDVRRALEHFERAVERDPLYAPAHVGIAAAWQAMADWNTMASPREALPRVRAAARRAIELDPTLAEAHMREAFVLESYEWKLAEAEAGYKRALALDPSYALAYHQYSLYLMRSTRRDEALEAARRAQQLDPINLEVNVGYGTRLNESGRHDEALAHLLHTVDLDPRYFDTWVHLSHVYERLGRHDDQVAAAERAVAESDRAAHAMQALARAYAVSRRAADSQRILAELHQRPERRNPYDVAMNHLRLKQGELALTWLQRACDERASAMARFPREAKAPLFDPVRADPRFTQILECVARRGTPRRGALTPPSSRLR